MGALVPIRSSGSARPLFIVHAALGTVLCYAELARHLGPQQPVYGLQSIGQHGETAPLASVHAMARHYLEAMRSVQLRGPYRLLGWSFGGAIAYAIAQLLADDDETVEFIGLIDSYVPVNTPVDESGALLALRDIWPVQFSAAQLAAVAPHAQRAFVAARCQEQGITLPGRPAAYLDVIMANAHAESRYHPAPTANALHLYCATLAEDGGDKSDPAPAWAALCQPGLHCQRIEATHASILKGDAARELAAAINAALATGSAPAAAPEYDPITLIQLGARDGNPVFCLPGAGANVAYFRQLAERLGAQAPVYGLQPRGLDGMHRPHASVDAMARQYVRAITPLVTRKQPVRLIGHSFGAQVAFAMARLLQQDGYRLDPLVLLDAAAPLQPGQTAPCWEGSAALLRLAHVLGESANTPLGIDQATLAGLDEPAMLACLHQRMVTHKLVPARTPLPVVAAMLGVFTANLNAAYRPDGQLATLAVLFHAALHLPSDSHVRPSSTDVTRAWRHYLPQLEARSAAGNHMTMLSGPHVTTLAADIRAVWSGQAMSDAACLDQGQA